MVDWFVKANRVLRNIRNKASDASYHLMNDEEEAAKTVNNYLKSDYRELMELWKKSFPMESIRNLGRHIHFGMLHDYSDIIDHDLPALEQIIEQILLDSHRSFENYGFEHLLHPRIIESSYGHFKNGHLRDAVLNSIISLYDHIREKTGIKLDGSDLIGKAFSPKDPYIILSDIKTDSGLNDQKGFMQIFMGSYQGIRNPKAHSLTHDLDEIKAAQYLVFASLMVRRIDEAVIVKGDSN